MNTESIIVAIVGIVCGLLLGAFLVWLIMSKPITFILLLLFVLAAILIGGQVAR